MDSSEFYLQAPANALLLYHLITREPQTLIAIILLAPFVLAGTRFMVAGVFSACGMPGRVSCMTTDMVIFFLAALLFFSMLDKQGMYLPGFSAIIAPLEMLANAIQNAGLY